ncbi:type 2 isopentenyl-diphosphate Delta-isomerase [Polycladomyces sp. WAk]|uniref:Isopentenyl-diphosphate delta-isomerase n=1 Tax=Polycladomyces zharkentensis TaxID=2807616 RepID=A0ABS2WMU0_9BACL|nr:type 2 isopentenyl-diphosphate Delta-isomerase [Polycladomyces sp. WAk]MBN2910892.1 type 2 isopentenyl-diphosphate Delta-isomerase [Polycladomyces sp. WAk]
MSQNQKPTKKRKAEHIEIVLHREVTGRGITTGLERYRFRHEALPEINFKDISLSTAFLGKPMKAPLLISSMTGGTKAAFQINKNLAQAAEKHGWAMGLGSVRTAIEHPETACTFQVRKYAPHIPLLANLGAVQLQYGYDVDDCRRIIELTEADALVLHLNAMQEVFQPEGNTRFAHLLAKIEEVCRTLEVPVGVKEVGMGIHGDLAKRLFDAGVQFVDVAGAGGTSWIMVEKHRSRDPILTAAAEAFADWGLPTADCIREARQKAPNGYLIASGGLSTGVEAAKAIALGADLTGFGRTLLRAATDLTPAAISRQLQRIEAELRIAMFGIGAADVPTLKGTDRIFRTDD